jgi:hypothetical protein
MMKTELACVFSIAAEDMNSSLMYSALTFNFADGSNLDSVGFTVAIRLRGLDLMPTSRGKIYNVEFSIVWNATRRTFDIERDGKATEQFARDKITAIRLASRGAQFENREGKTAVVYSTNADGKLIVEWSA